jgi:hypothetical protein
VEKWTYGHARREPLRARPLAARDHDPRGLAIPQDIQMMESAAMQFIEQCGLVLSATLLLAAASVQAYEVDSKTQQIAIGSLDDFTRCVRDLRSAPECLEALVRYAEKKPAEAFEAGKRARLEYANWAALPLFEIALRKKVDKAICADEDFHTSLMFALALKQGDILDKALMLGFNKCWNEAKDDIIKAAESDIYSFYLQNNTCPLFQVKGVSVKACEPKVEEKQIGPRPEILALKDIPARSLKLEQKSAMVLRGAEDEQVLLVQALGQENVWVVKFKNVRGAFNNKTFVTRELYSPNGRDYVTLIDNDERLIVSRRENWAAGMYESYLPGYQGLKVYRGALVDQTGPGSTAEIIREISK